MIKKITLFLMLFIAGISTAQTFLDFTDASYFLEDDSDEATVFPFSSVNSPGTWSIENVSGNNVFQYTGGTETYEGISILSSSEVDLSDDANNSVRFDLTVTETGSTGKHFIQFKRVIKDANDANVTEADIFMPFTAPTTVGTHKIAVNFGADLADNYTEILLYTDGDYADDPMERLISKTYNFDNFSVGSTVLSTVSFGVTSLESYPNPTQSNWTVKSKQTKISSIQLFDILGKNVLTITPNRDKVEIEGNKLNTGIYFAHIKTENNQIKSLKLVKN